MKIFLSWSGDKSKAVAIAVTALVLCRVGARRVALAVSSGSPRAEHVCPSRPSPNPLCKFPSDGLSRDRLSD